MNNTLKHRKKVLLLHGWDWRKYPKFKPIHQWQNRMEFLLLLKSLYDIDYPSLPGFGASNIPKQESWTIEDYTSWLEGYIKQNSCDVVIGYSFGAAVALSLLHRGNINLPTILVSPAILRTYKTKKRSFIGLVLVLFGKSMTQLLGQRFFRSIKALYMKFVVKNKFYTEATPFLRETYLNIVNVDLTDALRSVISSKNIHLVFGEKDTITSPQNLFSRVPEAKEKTTLIQDGGHHIGSTHPQQLFDVIQRQISQQQ